MCEFFTAGILEGVGVLAVIGDGLSCLAAQTLEKFHLWDIHLVWNLSSLVEISNNPFVGILDLFSVSEVGLLDGEVVGGLDASFLGLLVTFGEDGISW